MSKKNKKKQKELLFVNVIVRRSENVSRYLKRKSLLSKTNLSTKKIDDRSIKSFSINYSMKNTPDKHDKSSDSPNTKIHRSTRCRKSSSARKFARSGLHGRWLWE